MKRVHRIRCPITPGKLAVQILLLLWVIVTLFPIVWVAYSSLKTNGEILITPFSLPVELHFENYTAAWHAFGKNATLGTFLFNSLKVTILSVIIILLISVPCSYAIARYDFCGKAVVYVLLTLAVAIPAQGTVVPMYLQLNAMGIANNSHLGLSLAHSATQCAMPTLLLISYFKALPISVEEAALIDGCTDIERFYRIAVPLSMPAIVTVVILTFVNIWNDLLFSLVFLTKSEYKTLTQGLSFFVNEGGVDYARTFSAITISILPVVVVFLIFQKSIISAMTAGAEKG